MVERACDRAKSTGEKEHHMANAKDPVCGMDVTVRDTTLRATHQGTTYYFCSEGCKRSFEKEPARYAAK
jgi:YHS domain-containing protein